MDLFLPLLLSLQIASAVDAPNPDPLHEGWQQYAQSDYKAAEAFALLARRADPQKAWKLIGAARCQMGTDVEVALLHLNTALDREFVRYVCVRAAAPLAAPRETESD